MELSALLPHTLSEQSVACRSMPPADTHLIAKNSHKTTPNALEMETPKTSGSPPEASAESRV